MINKKIVYILLAFTLVAIQLKAKNVEITLKHNLDGYLSTYCLDIVGGGKNVDPSKGLQAHTCYSYKGSLGIDQIFDSNKLKKIPFICLNLMFVYNSLLITKMQK